MLQIDIGDLSILFAVTAIVLLVTSELISPYNRRITILLNRKRLRRVAIMFSIFFLVTVGMKVLEIVVQRF